MFNEAYLIQKVHKCVEFLEEEQLFSVAEATSGYWQIKLNDFDL